MVVVDANILIRAVLGRRVRELLERYAVRGVRFLAPEAAFEEASKYLPMLLEKRGIPRDDVPPSSLPFARQAAYNKRMEISFAPELEARLTRIASQSGKGPDDVVRELVATYLDHDEWFRQEVGKGLASLDQGKTVSHEDVRRQMDRILGS